MESSHSPRVLPTYVGLNPTTGRIITLLLCVLPTYVGLNPTRQIFTTMIATVLPTYVGLNLKIPGSFSVPGIFQ